MYIRNKMLKMEKPGKRKIGQTKERLYEQGEGRHDSGGCDYI